jgi:hypothetical protein
VVLGPQVLVKALDKLFILHAEHSLNCSTATMRQLASTLVDPYSAVAGSAAALYGPLHGGANEAVLRMLQRIGDVKNVPSFIEEVKSRKTKLFGFGTILCDHLCCLLPRLRYGIELSWFFVLFRLSILADPSCPFN